MVRKEPPTSLQRRFRLLQCAPTGAHASQAAKHLRQEKLRSRVAVVEYLCRFFKSALCFDVAAVNCRKHKKCILCLFDSFDFGMLNRPRPGGANIIKISLDF